MFVALCVSCILLIINQFDALFASAQIKWIPAILTYCVPFIVFIAGQCRKAESNS
ncbi:nitrate/nitrite transporter NrtS [Pseudoalteromonas denitrificans]|uniref:nitrate/nitrite transporter NrtS n=1 Tax=Pseudoalteromonas denitrificans TaxID=43656 RepID=UPI0011607ED3|nr:nitrate/nitrite transporter NrtS [Pseudoalteromonas denitrificans]